LLDERTLTSLLRLIAFLAVGAGLYGLWQTFVGFPSWDTRWIKDSGYEALQISKDVVRPFGTSASASEYTTLLAIGLAVWIGMGRLLGPLLWRLPAVVVLAVAVFYSSSRGPVVIVVATLALMGAVRRRLPIAASLAVAAVALLLFPLVVAAVAPGNSSDDLVSHQVSGLLHPFDPESSTLGKHISIVWEGLGSAVSYPLGQGISKTNLAGQKYGAGNQNTESDLSNTAVAMGIPGLALFGVIVVGGCRLAFRAASDRPDLRLVLFGVVLVTIFGWLNGGQYAVAWLPWLALGWLDRQRQQEREREREQEPSHSLEDELALSTAPDLVLPQPGRSPA